MERTILVADPDVSTLELATAVLTRNGFAVESTNDGGDALARFLETVPSVVICDAELPVLSGTQLCRHIRAHSSEVRVILLRSPGGSGTPVSGFDAIFERPFRFSPIKELLIEWGLLEEDANRMEIVAFGVPPVPMPVASIDPGEPDIPPDAAEVIAEHSQTPDTSDDAAPIPIPVPEDQPEEGVELDPARVTTREPEQRRSSTGLPPSVPRVGRLEELSLPRLLFELYVGTYSGQLVLRRDGTERRVFFWAGQPVFVDSAQLDERLGVLLRDEGRITDVQYEHAGAESIARGTRLGEALVDLGYISGADLLEALAAQTERKLINTLAWRDGKFELVDDTSFVQGEILTDVQPLKVIWRGVHEHYDLGAMMTFFARLRDRYVVTTDLFPVQFAAVAPHLRDLGVANWLNGHTTFEAALRSDDTRALQIAHALYVLLVTDMIRPATEPGDPAPVLERRSAEPASSTPVDYRFLTEVANRVASEYLRIKGKDHYAVLGVARDANTASIEDAYGDAVGVARKDLERPGLSHETRKRTREIIDVLAHARATLTDAEERRAYDSDLESANNEESELPKRQKAFFLAEQAYREGVRLLEMLDGRGARAQFVQALTYNPAEPTYRVAIAQAMLLELKDEPVRAHAAAFAYLDNALRLDPGNIPANLELAQLCIKQRQFDRARIHLERVLQRAPHHQKARRLLEELDAE